MDKLNSFFGLFQYFLFAYGKIKKRQKNECIQNDHQVTFVIKYF